MSKQTLQKMLQMMQQKKKRKKPAKPSARLEAFKGKKFFKRGGKA